MNYQAIYTKLGTSMIQWRKEGEEIQQGLSFYKLTDKHSIGLFLRVWNYVWRARYSKYAKKWFFTYNKIDPVAIEKFKTWGTLHGIKHD